MSRWRAALSHDDAAGVPLRDPDHVAGSAWSWRRAGRGRSFGLDVARARVAPLGGAPAVARGAAGRPARALDAGTAARGGQRAGRFYVTYLAYRNLKSVVPLLRPGDLFDRSWPTSTAGCSPATTRPRCCTTPLGTGLATHVLSSVYMPFFLFIPVTLAVALVFSRDLRAGLFYATALSVNWLLGAASYFLLPSLGPIYDEPTAFAELPATEVTRLQEMLLDQRVEFLRDPATGHGAEHRRVRVAAHLDLLHRRDGGAPARAPPRGEDRAWILVGLTVLATIYFGWHYVADDLGGVAIAVLALRSPARSPASTCER